MKKTLIRLLSMSICVMLLLTSVAFAEETDFSGIDWDAIGWQPDPENLEYKAKTDPITLSYYVNFSWFGLNWDDPTAERMTERTGVDLEFSKPVSDDGQKLNMMIAGNTLPDIMTLDRTDPAIQTMIEADMLYPIDELIEQYAPQMKEILPEELLNNYKSEDGHTYVLTTWVQGEAWQKAALQYNQMIGTNQYVWAVREDYYEEIGSPEIKTADDFIAALEQMSANHPDKLAFYCADTAMSASTFSDRADLHNVGIQFGLNGSISILDGAAKWAVRDPKFLEAIKFLNTLAGKGLLTKDCFIDSKDVQNARIQNGEVIAFSSTISDVSKIPADNPDTRYVVVGPLEGYQETRTGPGWFRRRARIRSAPSSSLSTAPACRDTRISPGACRATHTPMWWKALTGTSWTASRPCWPTTWMSRTRTGAVSPRRTALENTGSSATRCSGIWLSGIPATK